MCDDSGALVILASIAVHPRTVRNLPCNATLLGGLSANGHDITGQVYLVDRLTYAVLGFSYADPGSEGVHLLFEET